jgi:uncharacterized oxidoreductase
MQTTGNTILITGAGTGMGLEAAKQFSQRGNRIIMVARNQDRLQAEAALLENASVFACDIADRRQVDRLLRYLTESHPDLNVIFLNAGVTHTYSLFSDQDAFEHAQEEMTVNYLSAVRLTHQLEPRLSQMPEAAMIITTSGAAMAPDISNPTYSATKAALHSLLQSMRLVLERRNSTIKVFELMAPLVDSPFAKAIHSDHKVPPAEVIAALLTGLEADELEMHPGAAEDVYQLMRTSPEQALQAVTAITNA